MSKRLSRSPLKQLNNTFDSENNRSLKAPLSKHDISSEKLEVPVKDSENVLNVSDLARDLSDKLILGTPRQEPSSKFNTNKWASPSRSTNNSFLSNSGNNSLLSTSGNFSPSSDASFVTARDNSLTSNVCNSPGGDEIETICLDKTIDLSSDSTDSFNLTLDASIIPKVQPRSEKKSEGDDFEIVDIDCDKEDVKSKQAQQHSQDSSEDTESTEANDYIDSSVVSQDISYLSAEESISEEGTSRYASLENVYNTVIHYSQAEDYEVSVVGLNDITRATELGLNDITRATDVSVLGLNDITRADYTVQTLSATNVADESNVDQFIEEISVVESANKTALVDAKEQLLEKSTQDVDSESLNSSRTLNESVVNLSSCSANTESPGSDEPIGVEIVSDVKEDNLEQLEKHISELNLNSEQSVEEIRAANLSKSFTVVSEPDSTAEAKPDSNEQELATKSIVESTQDAAETFEDLERSKTDTIVSTDTKPIETVKEDSTIVPPEDTLNPVADESKQEEQQESEVFGNHIGPVANVTESEKTSTEKVINTSSIEKFTDESEVLASDINEKEPILSERPAELNSSSTEIQYEPLNLSIDNLKDSNQELVEQSLEPVRELTESSAENKSAGFVSKELTDQSLENPSEQIATENQKPTPKEVDSPKESQGSKPIQIQTPNSDPEVQAFEVKHTEQSVKTTFETPESKVQVPVVEKVEKTEHLPVEAEKTAATDLEPVELSESLAEVVEKAVKSEGEIVQDKVQEVKQSKEKETVQVVIEEEEKTIPETPSVPEVLPNQTENKEVEPEEESVSEPQEISEHTNTTLESINTASTVLVTKNHNLEQHSVEKSNEEVNKSADSEVIKTVDVKEPEVSAPEVKNIEKPKAIEVPIKTDLYKPETAVEQIKPVDPQETKSSEVKPEVKESEPESKETVVEKTEVAETVNTDLDILTPNVKEQISEPEVQVSVVKNVEKIQTVSFEVEKPVKLTNLETDNKTEITPLKVEKSKTAELEKPAELIKNTESAPLEVEKTKTAELEKPAEPIKNTESAPLEVKTKTAELEKPTEQEKPAELIKNTESAPLEVEKTNTAEQEKPTEQEKPAVIQAKATEISSVETPISALEIPSQNGKSLPLEENSQETLRKSLPLEENSAYNDSLGEFELIESQLSSDQAEEEKRLSERFTEESPADVSSNLLENVIPDELMEDEHLNKSEAGPDTAEISKEEFQSSEEWFKNPGSFDFLEQVSNKARIAESELRKQSLYVKFDPLLKSPIRQRPSVKSIPPQNNIMEEESLNDSKPISELNDSVTNLSESPNVSSVPSQISNVSPNVSTVSCQPDAAGDANSSSGAEIEKLKKENALFQKMLNDYENTITQCVNQREADKKQFEKYKKELEKEKEEAQLHLRNSEIAFNDVHQKYERSRAIIEGMKANEDELKARQSEMEEELKKQNNKYEVLKNHAISQLEKANQDLELRMKTNEVEQAKLKAMLKKSEMHITSLQESLARKTQENAELTSICDDLLSKVGVNS